MDQFSRWSGIAHSLVVKHTPTIQLGQVHQLLAACLGHRTYNSLRVEDLATLSRKPPYVLFDVEAGFARAQRLGLALTEDQWREVTMALRPSGVTPFWLTTMKGMSNAARIAFEDSPDDRIRAMKREVGFPDGHQALLTRCHTGEDTIPEWLRFDVEGEVYAINDHASVAIPVRAIVEFHKVGRRMYGEASLVTFAQHGQFRVLNDDERNYDGEFYGMSED